jgi:hypothetical protein
MSQPQFQSQFYSQFNGRKPWWRYPKFAVLLVSLVLLNACMQQSPLIALGLQSGIKADSHTRLRFPAHTPVLIRFDATQAPEAWAVAAHQGVALHFPKAQRQQTPSHGLEWFIRWPYVEPPQQAPQNSKSRPSEPPNSQLSAESSAWYSLNRTKQRLTGAKQRVGELTEWLPSPLFWRRDKSERGGGEPLPAHVRGLAQVVVSDRNNGKILALADVQIDQSILVRLASAPRDQINPSQRRTSNERQIAKAFAALAASLVASGDS